MAEASNLTNVGLLKTAGVQPDAYASMIERAAHDAERFVPLLQSIGDATPYLRGSDAYVPVVATRSIDDLYTKVDTGSGPTESTNNKGQNMTLEAESGSAVQLQEKWQGDAAFMSRYDWEQLDPDRRAAYLRALGLEQAAALGEARDSSIASIANPSLISAGNQINASAPANITFDDIATIMEKMVTLKQRGPYYLALPANQFSVCLGIEQLTRFNWTGAPGLLADDLAFKMGPLTIFCHNQAYSDGVDGNWGMCFGPGALKFSGLGVNVEDWYENLNKSHYTSVDQAYKYGLIFQRVVTIQTPA